VGRPQAKDPSLLIRGIILMIAYIQLTARSWWFYRLFIAEDNAFLVSHLMIQGIAQTVDLWFIPMTVVPRNNTMVVKVMLIIWEAQQGALSLCLNYAMPHRMKGCYFLTSIRAPCAHCFGPTREFSKIKSVHSPTRATQVSTDLIFSSEHEFPRIGIRTWNNLNIYS